MIYNSLAVKPLWHHDMVPWTAYKDLVNIDCHYKERSASNVLPKIENAN